MANLGEITEVVNAAERLTLELGADKYILMQEIELVQDRREKRMTQTDGGVEFFYGSGDIYFDATLLVSNPEISAFNTLTQRSSGNLTSQAYKIVVKAKDGTTKTFNVTAVIPTLRTIKPTVGAVKHRIRFRVISDVVSVT